MTAFQARVDRPITAAGVRAAARRIAGRTVQTPLIENDRLNEIAGGRVLLKAEVLQGGGSFKLRGAYNLISQLSKDALARGVVAWSSGNHANGVAIASRAFGCPAVIVMPSDAPAVKVENVRANGAEIVFYDRYSEDREAIGVSISNERNMTLVPSYDHPDIIEGQGTVALESLEQTGGVEIDRFLVCCGGGGLTAGCATFLEDASPQTDVWIAEPEGFDDAWESIRLGRHVTADQSRKTLCDAIATPSLGKLTYPILQRRVRGGAAVTDKEVKIAMAFAFRHLKLVVEPGGAAALAAILAGKAPTSGVTTVATLSGGNVDKALFASILCDEEINGQI